MIKHTSVLLTVMIGVVAAFSVRATTYAGVSEFDAAIRISDHVVVVEIAGSKVLASTDPNSPGPCAMVYRGRVVESFGPRDVNGDVDFASDVQLKTGARYLLFLASAMTASGARNPYTEMFISALGREGCVEKLSGLNTDVHEYAFEIRESKEHVTPPGAAGTLYIALDQASVHFPAAITESYEQITLCKGDRTGEQQCDLTWKTTLIEWESVRRFVRSYLQEHRTNPE